MQAAPIAGLFAFALCAHAPAQIPEAFRELPELPLERLQPKPVEWLVEAAPQRAGVYRQGTNLVLDNGLLRRTLRLVDGESGCGLGSIGLDDLTHDRALLRAVRPEAKLVIDGEALSVGGLLGQANHAYLDAAAVQALRADPSAMGLRDLEVGPITERMAWAQVRHHAPDLAWPPAGVHLTLTFGSGELEAQVHYNLYDGLPAYSKWLVVHNRGEETVTVDRFASEVLAAVEHSSRVESRGLPQPHPDLHVETDYAFGGMSAANSNRHGVHWLPDPDYQTQVNYQRETPCLLEVGPEVGPAQRIAPHTSWSSFRAFVLAQHGDRERRGLARRRLMRTVAPWVTENPLMMHVRWSDDDSVRSAIDQCAAVGFEMVILTFGSGFNLEDDSEANWGRMRALADYAKQRGIEIGGYSLLSSRRIQPDSDNCIHPETGEPGGNIHGFCPALASDWGQAYFDKLYRFYASSGFQLLEHDGSYPGDLDAAARPPLQQGLEDSRWVQWRIITDFYSWCRGKGIYLNIPDHYYLAGANKCGMGYRETNWSLPRAQQVIHARQNMFDGTWEKTPSMGWMFVPLTEYHGGGAAATIEPLAEHLPHYDTMLQSHLGLGVQACYRGPRLFDGPETEALVRKRVQWFQEHRRLLESDLVHGRRADGRDLDWMLHVDPFGPTPGMLMVFNPLPAERSKTLHVDLTYTGLQGQVSVIDSEGQSSQHPTAGSTLVLPVKVPANSMTWYLLR